MAIVCRFGGRGNSYSHRYNPLRSTIMTNTTLSFESGNGFHTARSVLFFIRSIWATRGIEHYLSMFPVGDFNCKTLATSKPSFPLITMAHAIAVKTLPCHLWVYRSMPYEMHELLDASIKVLQRRQMRRYHGRLARPSKQRRFLL